ncbi:LOW QUALITY PROTEIN: hypothetical protein PanWU01x14_328170 [Parasponia andersonii]|uniref:Uncharacterized protein n=1 Tax=Parasponia andersonii TaxID=3476 RepID=A0A2P5AIU5_PARAD|nr:LOW QUALITY PROTEIN: hypothetical protein PanWU01x14_328170 [Parasponia andersonii]
MSNLAKVTEFRHILFLKDAEEGQLAESPGWNPKILFHALRAGKHIKRKTSKWVQVPHVGKIVESLDESWLPLLLRPELQKLVHKDDNSETSSPIRLKDRF